MINYLYLIATFIDFDEILQHVDIMNINESNCML